MSATPIPYLLEELQGGYALGTIFTERSISSFPDVQLHIGDAPPGADPESIFAMTVMDSGAGFTRAPERPLASFASARSALDIGRPGLLDQLDHGIGHRDIIEFLGHPAALRKGPFEELDGFAGCRLIDRLLVHQDEGCRGDRP